MNGLQQTLPRVVVPAGFSGWWCERCERPCHLPEEAGSPAKCPHCRKYTAVWVPPQKNAECGMRNAEYKRVQPTQDQARELFAEMRQALETGGTVPPATEENWQEGL